MATRRVVFVLYDGFQPLDLTGPHEVFAGANELADVEERAGPRYTLEVAAPVAGPVRAQSGLEVHAGTALAEVSGPLDTLLVVGGRGMGAAGADRAVVEGIARAATEAQRVVSVCTGAFLLAEAGLLEGRRATTHWAYAARLARDHPGVDVDPTPLFVRDGHVWTAAGVTAGIDLALSLVEADWGVATAQTVARHLVMFLRRPGGQSQFSVPLWSAPPAHEPVRTACELVQRDPGADLSVAALAAAASMSTRHFVRVFSRQVGRTPGRYVEDVRLEAARRELEVGLAGVDAVARACGFGTAETLRRMFVRRLGVSPTDYRKRFSPSCSP
ncbi:MAG: helix-turn-helix domain-containing protein [Acidimicrobiia bacterium]|nr:helix-turn-helix domain-containing protein [Acidimicrobiia bacterium]